MAGRPSKSLSQRVADGSFEPRRHRRLLDGPLLSGPPELRELQVAYQRGGDETVRRRLSREFEELARRGPPISTLECVRAMGFSEFTRTLLGFELAAFQAEFEEEASRVRPDGRRAYKRAFLVVPRGAGKTLIASARAFYELLRREDQIEVLAVAGDKEQAGHALRYAKRWIRASVELAGAVDVTADELRVGETGSVLKVLAARAASSYGSTPDVLICDELHVWTRGEHEELWTAHATSMIKKPDSFTLAISTAPSKPDSLLAGILETELAKDGVERPHDCLTISRDERAGTLVMYYGAPDGADLDDEGVWRRCNPGPWISLEDLRQARLAPGVSDEAFALQHLNRPSVEPADALISRRMFDRCRDATLEPPEGAPIAVGVERAFGGGSCAVAWVWQSPENRVVVRCRVLATEHETCEAHERTPSWRRLVDMDQVELGVQRLGERFDVRRVGFDPGEVRLQHERLQPVKAGSMEQREASRRLFSLLENGELAHDGDPVLADHLLATRGVWDTHERLSVYRREQGRSIAGWYAIVNALAVAGDGFRSVYEDRGVVVLGWIPDADEPHYVDGELVNMTSTRTITIG